MQRPHAIVLLCAFAAVLLGLYPMQWAMQRMLRNEVAASIRSGNIPTEHLVHLSFALAHGEVADAHFQWSEDDEFRFNGRMYDVVERRTNGNTIELYCIADGEEDLVLQCARALDPMSDGPGDGHGRSPLKFLAKHFLPHGAVVLSVPEDHVVFAHLPSSSRVRDGFAQDLPHPPWA